MGSETAYWVRRDAFFTFSNSYSSSYGCWFTRRLWRISFRYRFHSHFHCTFLVPHLITFLVTFWWLNSDGSCVLCCVAGDVWCNWCKITCWTSSRGFNLLVFILCYKFCFFLYFFHTHFGSVSFFRFSIRLCMNFQQSIPSLKACHCVNFSVIPLHR